MEDLSEKAIIENCPHCNPSSQAFKYLLGQTENFFVVCDAHPIVEGHILIIPKKHISCIGDYSEDLYLEFLPLNNKVSNFLLNEYGFVSSFEHGIFGQTVFHSHVHYLPYCGKPTDIIPEGEEKLFQINDLSDLKTLLKRDDGYLFFSIEENMWNVDVSIAAPRFFRDRFATAFGKPERGNWKNMRVNLDLMEMGKREDLETQRKWKKYFFSPEETI